jgi:hypothetical protein
VVAAASSSPNTTPVTDVRNASPSTVRNNVAGLAPIAIRTPNSCVCVVSPYAITP